MALIVGPLRHRAQHFVLVLNPKEEHLSFGSIIATQVVVYAVDLEHRGLEARVPTFTRFFSVNPVLFCIRGWESGGRRFADGTVLTRVFSLSLSP